MTPEHYEIAKKHIGLAEFKGKGRHNAEIIEFSKSLGHSWVKTDEVPWCAAFVGACLEEAGIKSTKKLNARSYLKWGKRIWGKPKIGDVVIFKRGNSNWQGHVAFYAGETKNHIKCLGGNQSNKVKISLYSKSKLLGIRRAELPVAPPDIEIEGNEIGEEELEQAGSRTIKHAKGNKDVGGVVGFFGLLGLLEGILEYVKGFGETLGDWAGSLNTISNALTQLLAIWPVALLLCGGIVIWRNREIIKARISDEPKIGRVNNATPD